MSNKIKGLGELVLRVNDMERMKNFYADIIGLELMRDSPDYKFFKIADGYNGHTQVLALFSKSNEHAFGEIKDELNISHSSLHHFALEIAKEDRLEMIDILKQKGIPYKTETFDWVNWKSIFLKDPDGNILEFVCYDNE